ncbi:MAG: DUF2867 domain-containing protein [Marinilabiliales bacterium]|nr:MAG: DUF2867 domain-containing protein [Marinilabiliales bacterium]
MKILLTGATGYIGKRLLPALIQEGHYVVCLVRDAARFHPSESFISQITVLEADLLRPETLVLPNDIDAAYYLVHSMSNSKSYTGLEEASAKNFIQALSGSSIKQVIYLSGIVNEENLSPHLSSRKNVEEILQTGNFHLTTLRAGIIIGSGSASFEIIRDLVEKLPIMVTPRWLNTKCQPIGIEDVIRFLQKALNNEKLFDRNFDIGGPDILTYKEMLLQYALVRNLKRKIWIVPVMTPRLSSYWLYFVTSTTYRLAVNLVDSMKVEVVCRDNAINDITGVIPDSYREALNKTFSTLQHQSIISSWKDAGSEFRISDFIQVPEYGCFKDTREKEYESKAHTIEKIWRIGGETGWYFGNWLWQFRGFLDKVVGGVGLRRGRTNINTIDAGDSLDFWRVLYANKKEGRLLLFAEMKLPGEAWLEFRIKGNKVIQTATFRPKGLAGRLYWFAVLPVHGIIFKGMINRIAS